MLLLLIKQGANGLNLTGAGTGSADGGSLGAAASHARTQAQLPCVALTAAPPTLVSTLPVVRCPPACVRPCLQRRSMWCLPSHCLTLQWRRRRSGGWTALASSALPTCTGVPVGCGGLCGFPGGRAAGSMHARKHAQGQLAACLPVAARHESAPQTGQAFPAAAVPAAVPPADL